MKIIKKCLCVLLIAVFLCGSLAVTSYAADITGTPTRQTVIVNNQKVSIQGYTIEGSNYFKLRDLAMIIKGNGKDFSINWDARTNAAWLTQGSSYISLGNELAMAGSAASITAVPTTTNLYLNGKQIYITAYLIGNANYIKLRDLGAAMDFGVTYDDATDSVLIDTAQKYYVATILNALPGSFYRPAELSIYYFGKDSGRITVFIPEERHFVVSAYDILSANDIDKFELVLSFLISTPNTVLEALKELEPSGKKELTLDGKTVVCISNGRTQTVDIKW